MGLARALAHRYRDLGLPVEDLVQEGAIGLLEAVDRFDPRSGATFSTYAFWRVRQSITHALTDQGRVLRLPKKIIERRRAIAGATALLANAGRVPTTSEIADVTGLSAAEVAEALAAPTAVGSLDAVREDGTPLEAAIADAAVPDPEAAALAHIEKSEVDRAVARLPDRQRLVISARFGFGREAQTLAEVGAALHVSPVRARAIERSALYGLATELVEQTGVSGRRDT